MCILPRLATSWEQTTSAPGISLATMFLTLSSCRNSLSMGEYTPATTTALIPSSRISRHTSTTCSSTMGLSSDPSICKPPSTYPTYPRMIFASPTGQSANGLTSLRKLFDSRTTATLLRRRLSLSMTEFKKAVVPIVTEAMLDSDTLDSGRTARRACSIPCVGFRVVGTLCEARTPRVGRGCWEGSSTTASVFVPFVNSEIWRLIFYRRVPHPLDETCGGE